MTNADTAYEADSFVHAGIRLVETGHVGKAISSLEKGLDLFADHPFGRLHLGLALVAEGRSAEAVPHLRRALELRPESAAFHLFVGRAYFDIGDHASARDAFRRAVQINCENELAQGYLILSKWGSGVDDAPEELDPDNVADSTPFLARLLMLMEADLKGRTVDFSDETKHVPLLDGLRIAWLLWWAVLDRKRGRFAEAMARAEMAMELHPGHPGAGAFLKECRDGALQAAQRRLAENPDAADRNLELAGLLADADRYEEAAEHAERAKALVSEHGDEGVLGKRQVKRLVGRICYGVGRIDEAIELERAGAEPGLSMPETHYYLGLCYLAQGRRRLCLQEFEPLVSKMCWLVPLRLREYQAWRSGRSRPEWATGVQTSPSDRAEDSAAPI